MMMRPRLLSVLAVGAAKRVLIFITEDVSSTKKSVGAGLKWMLHPSPLSQEAELPARGGFRQRASQLMKNYPPKHQVCIPRRQSRCGSKNRIVRLLLSPAVPPHEALSEAGFPSPALGPHTSAESMAAHPACA